jgi:hypothetical protein
MPVLLQGLPLASCTHLRFIVLRDDAATIWCWCVQGTCRFLPHIILGGLNGLLNDMLEKKHYSPCEGSFSIVP